MARLQGTQRNKLALYSFAVDGGAASSINLGIFVPNNAGVVGFFVKTNTAPTSGGAATIAYGHSADTDQFMVVTGIAAFVAAEMLQGVDMAANPAEMTAERQLQITIGTAALTAGIIVSIVSYVEMDV